MYAGTESTRGGPFLDSADANLKNHSNHSNHSIHTDTNIDSDTHPPRPKEPCAGVGPHGDAGVTMMMAIYF
jgi:hypothetical protein